MTPCEAMLIETMRELQLMAFKLNCQRRFVGEIPWPCDYIVEGLLTCAAALPAERMVRA
jgi:hypothetical protein